MGQMNLSTLCTFVDFVTLNKFEFLKMLTRLMWILNYFETFELSNNTKQITYVPKNLWIIGFILWNYESWKIVKNFMRWFDT
jgi:hypothetical protein